MTVRITRVFLDVVGGYSDAVIEQLQGTIPGASSISGTALRSRSLSGTIAAASSAVGSLSVSTTVFVSGTIPAASSAEGTLSVKLAIRIAGEIQCVSYLVATVYEPPHFEYIAGVLPAVSYLEIAEPVFISDHLFGRVEASPRVGGILVPFYSISYQSDHVTTGLLRLIEQFKNKPILSGVISSYLVGVQRLEDTLYSLLAERNIWAAVGSQLDGLGFIVGAERGGDNDDEFRERILVTVLINASHGSPEDIIEVFSYLTSAEIELSEFHPAAISVYIKKPLDSADNYAQARRFAGYLDRAKPAGVSAKLYFQGSASEVVKAFDTVDRGFDAGRFAGVAI